MRGHLEVKTERRKDERGVEQTCPGAVEQNHQVGCWYEAVQQAFRERDGCCHRLALIKGNSDELEVSS